MKHVYRHDVLVIGGGASGMMAAIQAAALGADTAIIEHTDKAGKKILMTGNGRCNLTNTLQTKNCYRGKNPDFTWQAFSHFNEKDTIQFFNEAGLLLKERNGYVYPFNEQAAAVREVLLDELLRLKAAVYYETEITRTERGKAFFRCFDTNGRVYEGRSLILAAGSKAAPKTGSDGSGYALAEKLGHKIIKPLPALVQLEGKGSYFKSIAGVRTHAALTLYIEEKRKEMAAVASDTGELQLTDYGISGIPVFQVSRFASAALNEHKKVIAEIDFLPLWEQNEIRIRLKKQLRERNKTVRQVVSAWLNSKLAAMLCKQAELSENAEKLSDVEEKRLLLLLKHFRIEITAAKSFDYGQICAGGVDTEMVCADTMQSLKCPGLFFCGEILDVDGICGGYNLQWAWTSGFLAGNYAAQRAKEIKQK